MSSARRHLLGLLAGGLLLGGLLLGGAGVGGCGGEGELPEIMRIGEFSLRDPEGRAFGSAELRGRVWIASFIFTRCTEICPLLSSQMANLRQRITHPEVHFVSITVDPEHDTPARMGRYASRFGADPERWTFLSGEPREVRRVLRERFRVVPGAPRRGAGQALDIEHEAHFFLVDPRGVLRGSYGSDRASLEALRRDAESLAGAAPTAERHEPE